MPGAMGTQHLSRAVGLARAFELSFTGNVFSASQALTWGLVNQIIDQNKLTNTALTTANTIAQNAPKAIRQVKKAIQASRHTELKQGYALELAAYYQLLPTRDRREGINAFNEKRKPHFTNE